MIALHGGYLPRFRPGLFGLYLWGEGPFDVGVPRGLHPRALRGPSLDEALRSSLQGLLPPAVLARSRRGPVVLVLPARDSRPVPSLPALRDDKDYRPGLPSLSAFEVEAVFIPSSRALEFLLDLSESVLAAPELAVAGDDLEYWALAGRWGWDLLLRRRVVPGVVEGTVRWHAVLPDAADRERFELLSQAMPPVSRALATSPQAFATPVAEGLSAAALLRAFLADLVDAAARELVRDVIPSERRRRGAGPETQALATLALPRIHPSGEPGVTAAQQETPSAGAAGLDERLSAWTLPLLAPGPEGDLRLGLRLVPPEAGAPESAPWEIRYHLSAADDPTLEIAADEVWGLSGTVLGSLGRRFRNPSETLLAQLGRAASFSSPVARSLDERRPEGAELTLEETFRFLSVEAPLLSEAGFRVLLPGSGRSAPVSVRLGAHESAWKSGSAVTRFGLATLVDFDWKVAVGGVLLSPEEFEELASRKVPLVKIRGDWVVLDEGSVRRALALLDRRPAGHTTLGDLLRIAAGIEGTTDTEGLVEEVTGDGWLAGFLDPARAREEIGLFAAPASLVGTLRPYQQRGVAWMRFLAARGFGACLADDMGLGKTVQFLATLLSAREAGEQIRPTLLVCPTSVAENWVREAARFAPGLSVLIHHGPDRATGDAFDDLLRTTDVLVTTYPLVHRDRALLSRHVWEYLALDEAQNVKNAVTAQARAVRALSAHRRVALTGTPVENRLSELKSIFDFLSPGLLGTEESFRKTFAVPIERHHDEGAAERLRRLTAPFLLRRLKTDPTVEPDLPEKIETKEYVGLSREQATLYRATTKALLEGIGRARGATRRARVLVLLLRLKQICDHPSLFLSDGSRLDGRSAKLVRLLEMLEETHAERRPALLFTQFAEMGHLLVRALRDRFGGEVLFLHGGVPRKARGEMVRRFQEDGDGPLFFVLSLKAGGSGLNLTRASHVFHFDRWWNPAVEDQATDRVFRIGQTRHVQVHKFVCRGTLEERIDAMIDEKKEIARSIIGAGESWLSRLSDDELAQLVTLDRDAVDEAGR